MTEPTTDFTEILWARTLPKITAAIIEDHESLINCDGNWTQAAVDFAVLLNIHDTPLLEQLGVLAAKLEAAEEQTLHYKTELKEIGEVLAFKRKAAIIREEKLEAAEAKLKAIGKLPRLGIDADIEEVGYVYGPRPDGPFVSWHRLQKALKGEYND